MLFRSYQRKEIKQIAIAAAAGASLVLFLVIFAAAVFVKYLQRLRHKDSTIDVEIGRLKKYVEDTFQDIRDTTLRMATPSVPSTPLHSNKPDPNQEIRDRLNALRAEEHS